MAAHLPTPSDRSGSKEERYREVEVQIVSVLDGETNLIAKMATVAAMLSAHFDYFYWTGFYMVDPLKPKELVIGPYQGTLGCLRIPFGRGVCGAAAATSQTQIVEDVLAYPDHIACDVLSKSEVVVPVFDGAGVLLAVLDVDAEKIAAFDHVDAEGLRTIVTQVFA